jgi:hypothetical protein
VTKPIQVLLCGLCFAYAAIARADEPLRLTPPTAATSIVPSICRYQAPHGPNYVRAVLEEVGLLGLGFTQYVANHDLNSVDWDFNYTWPGLRQKLSPKGYSFDTNGFDTNFTRHPAAGATYYWVARGNRLSVLESVVAATIASTLWEYIGELRERASLNDLWVTPLSGMVLGEMTVQLGAFFDRGCDTIPNRALGTLLGTVKTAHDALDSATPLRERSCDRYGLSRLGAHSLELSITAGALSTVAGPRVPTRFESRLELHTQLVALDTYGAPGTGTTHFIDGNVSELSLRSSFAGALWNDFTVRAAMMPLGLHARSIAPGPHGQELLFGLLTETEYSVHRFGQWSGDTQLRDRYFELDVPGVSLIYRILRGETVLALELQACAAFVAVDAIALPEFRALGSVRDLPAVTRADGYNYGLGVRLQPRASLTYRGFAIGVDVSAVRAHGITWGDRYQAHAHYASGNERRTIASGWLRIGPASWPVRLTLNIEWLQRWGALDGVHAQRAELSTRAGLGAVF